MKQMMVWQLGVDGDNQHNDYLMQDVKDIIVELQEEVNIYSIVMRNNNIKVGDVKATLITIINENTQRQEYHSQHFCFLDNQKEIIQNIKKWLNMMVKIYK